MFHILLEGFIIGDRQLDTHKIPIFPCGRTNTNQVPSYITKCLSSKNLVIFYWDKQKLSPLKYNST
jgi:hypothetical protein